MAPPFYACQEGEEEGDNIRFHSQVTVRGIEGLLKSYELLSEKIDKLDKTADL